MEAQRLFPPPPRGAVAAPGPCPRDRRAGAGPRRKAQGAEGGMKLVSPLALDLWGSSRRSGERFNDQLHPCSPRPSSSERLSITREGSRGERAAAAAAAAAGGGGGKGGGQEGGSEGGRKPGR